MTTEPVLVRETAASERVNSFDEVIAGYTEDEALRETSRCLQCKKPVCIEGCPVDIDIKTFISQTARKDYSGAYFTIREKNDFPSICGRVCPAEYQCRKACVLTKKGLPFASEKAINIHLLERFIGDYGIRNKLAVTAQENGKLSKYKVAVVGSGPAGLCAAGELARRGIKVTVFEGLHKPGGVLRYGIPSFRLPRNVLDIEIAYLKRLGVEIVTNFIVGKSGSLPELFDKGYACVFLGLGAGIPSFLGVPGETLCNIYSANEFLTRVNLMGAHDFPRHHTPINIGRHIIVIGGGNTAIDASRVALRLQKINGIMPNTTIFYRRTEIEMPARRLEIEHAKEEGVGFEFLLQPTAFAGDGKGYARKLKALRCRLGEPDNSGRKRPIPIAGSDFEVDCDLAIIAIGLEANRILTRVTPELKTDKYGDLLVSRKTMKTSMENVYAGGDIVGGEGTVIEAMGMAKTASLAIIDRFLKM